eukprot:CAMPEP_0197239918 /NCGR_PEP_ID=MMETSP1429-20130617/6322_1 /TAXON_ID=49237 /ORGANISM="Chaetoceros  sp., Strain UNC1202" /LENGTH=202 /DNA_ID=CAMNT_0042699463 /DNA_START=36 /DNA_END=641 /DNA_ORIENTATION=-
MEIILLLEVRKHRSGARDDTSDNRERENRSLNFSTLPHELWFEVFSYAYGNSLMTSPGADHSSITTLFRDVSPVSKGAFECCTRYVQQTPLSVHFDAFDYWWAYDKVLRVVIWMCKTRVSLGDLRISHRGSRLELNIIMYLTDCCDIEKLKHLKYSTISRDSDNEERVVPVWAAIKVGIPLRTKYSSDTDFIVALANTLAQR